VMSSPRTAGRCGTRDFPASVFCTGRSLNMDLTHYHPYQSGLVNWPFNAVVSWIALLGLSLVLRRSGLTNGSSLSSTSQTGLSASSS
jgi:hypothetical protein